MMSDPEDRETGGVRDRKSKAETLGREKRAVERERRVEKLIDAWLEDPEVMQALPPGEKAKLISARLPKLVPIDQKVEERLLSLASMLEDLPDHTVLQRQLVLAKQALGRLRAESVARTALYSRMKNMKNKEFLEVVDIFEQFSHDAWKQSANERSLADFLGVSMVTVRDRLVAIARGDIEKIKEDIGT
jgi:hypothetical protein